VFDIIDARCNHEVHLLLRWPEIAMRKKKRITDQCVYKIFSRLQFVPNLALEWWAELLIWEITNSKLGLWIGYNLHICRDSFLPGNGRE